jgi:hypothetical protein
MARLHIDIPTGFEPEEIRLNPGCNRVGREGDVDILLAHPSVSRAHCELWLMDEVVMVRDLESRNGTFIEGERVQEAQILEGQRVRLGDVELRLVEAPARISVPDIPLPAQPKQQLYMEDGTPCCYRHDGLAALFQCGKCQRAFCGACVRELRVAGGTPRRFCPECGGACERLAPTAREQKRGSWLDKIVKAFTQPPRR